MYQTIKFKIFKVRLFTTWAGTGPQPTIHNIKHKI